VGPIGRYRAILGQGVWVLSGQALAAIFTVAGTRLITQFVAPDIYGIVNLTQNAVVLLRTLFCQPILNVGLRYYPDAERGKWLPALHRMLRRVLGKATVVMELLLIVGGCVWIWHAGVKAIVVAALAVFLFADVFRTLEMTLLGAARRQRPAAIASAGEALVKPLLIVASVLLFGPTTQAVLAAIALSVLITLIGLRAAAPSESGVGAGPLPSNIATEMRRYAIPLVPIALLNWLTALSDRYIIQWLSHDLSSVGVYAAGYGLVSQPLLMLHAVAALTLRPVYFSAVSRNDRERAARTFTTWLALSAAASVAATLLIFFLRGPIVDIFLGPKYRNAVLVIPWIALGYVFYVVEQVLEQHLLAHKRTRAVLLAQACGAMASVVVTVPLVALYGMVGAAYACPIYFLIQNLVAAWLILHTRRGPMKPDDVIL
jgi:O-antigen/teichoic acid export membrane protein